MRPYFARGAGALNALQNQTSGRDSSTLATESNLAHSDQPNPGRRDFIYVATAAVATVGVGAVVWPVINQMNPDASVLAMASTEFDLSGVEEGASVTIKWRGSPVFVRHRTAQEVEEARATPLSDLKDPETDEHRVKEGHEAILVMVGLCTHLGCVPVGESGEFGGWYCPCHGSQYDTSGRIRKGPAPKNLVVPPYKFLSDTVIQIG